MIISSGLNDRSKYLQQYVRNIMLKSWLKFVDGNIIELLKCFDVTYDDNSYNTAALVLKVLSHNTVLYAKRIYGFVPVYDPPMALCKEALARSETVSSFE